MPTVYSKNALVEVQRKYKLLLSGFRDRETRRQLRELREVERRVKALEASRAKWKSQSKDRRENLIALQRALKLRSSYETFDDTDVLVSQSGFGSTVAAVGAASAAVAAVGVYRAAGSVSEALNSVSNTVAQAGVSVETVLASLRSFVDVARSTLGIFWLLPVAIGLYLLWRGLMVIPFLLGAVLQFVKSTLGEVWGWLSSFFCGVQSQSDITSAAAYFATVAAVMIVPRKNPSVMVGEIMRRVGSFERSQTGLVAMFEGGLKYVEKALNAVLSLFTDKRVDWAGTSDKLVNAWSRKVDDFELACVRGNPDLSELRKAIVLLQEGIGFRQMMKSAPTLAFLNKYTDKLSALLQAHKGALNSASAFRMAPLSVMLGGGSGVGKTSVVKWVASAFMLLAGVCEPDEVLNNMWQKGISEYWNGYVQQKVYIMDDCFQQKTDGKQLDNEAMFMIRAVGNWAFPLNFADLDSKGRFYFMSDAIMGTTNVQDIYSHVAPMVAEPTAVVRRIDYGYWVFVSPEYQREGTTQLDYGKVAREIRANRAALGDEFTVEQLLECIPWRAWNIVPHDFQGVAPNNVRNDVTLLDVVKQMVAQYTDRARNHAEEVEDLEAWSRDLSKCIRSQSGVGSHALDTGASELDEVVERIARHRSEWTLGCSQRLEWISSAILEVRDWFTNKGLPPALSWIYGLVASGITGVSDSVDRWIERIPGLDDKYSHIASAIAKSGMCLAIVKILSFVASSAIGIFKAVVGVICGFFPGFGKTQTQSNTQPQMEAKTKLKMPRIASQLGNPPEDHHSNIVYNNTYKMVVEDGDDRHVLGQLIFVEGDMALIPSHFAADLADKNKSTLCLMCVANPAFTVRMPVSVFLALPRVSIPEADVLFVRFHRKMLKAHRSIVNQFFTESALGQFLRNKKNHVRLDVARLGGKQESLVRTTMVSAVCEYMTTPIVTDKGKYSYVVSYDMPTMAGDCGAPLTVCEPRFWGGSCLIGFHIAGKAGLCVRKGYSAIVTRENVYAARTGLGAWADNFTEDLLRKGVGIEELSYQDLALLQSAGIVAGSHVPICKLDKGVSVGGASKIKASPMQADEIFGPCPTRPSHLRPVCVDGVWQYPMAKAMEAYQSPLEFDRSRGKIDLRNVTEIAMRPHWDVTSGYDTSILTFEEAVCPPPCYKMKPLNRTTSAGYPYRFDSAVGKKAFFGVDGDFDFTSSECHMLRQDVELMLEAARRNERLAVVFTDFPKDEVRPHAKVDAVATRAISGAPLNYVVAVRMYFGAFIAASFATHTENGMAPGINPYTDWHVLATKLAAKGEKVFAGDFSRFDASEQPEIHEHILAYINRWYRRGGGTDEDNRVRSVLWLDLIHSRHLTGTSSHLDVVVQWSKSLPSGHPLTTLVNSMYSLITLTACYTYLTGDHRGMWSKVQLMTYGDDNVNSVSDDVAEIFNQVTVAAAMKELFGLTYTSDKKGQDLIKYETIHDVTFLKRSFVCDAESSGGWCAPLDLQSFLYIPYWFKNPRDPEGDLEQNVELMLGELCLHDGATWDKYFAPLSKWCDSYGVRVPFLTRELARAWTLSRSDVWH